MVYPGRFHPHIASFPSITGVPWVTNTPQLQIATSFLISPVVAKWRGEGTSQCWALGNTDFTFLLHVSSPWEEFYTYHVSLLSFPFPASQSQFNWKTDITTHAHAPSSPSISKPRSTYWNSHPLLPVQLWKYSEKSIFYLNQKCFPQIYE